MGIEWRGDRGGTAWGGDRGEGTTGSLDLPPARGEVRNAGSRASPYLAGFSTFIVSNHAASVASSAGVPRNIFMCLRPSIASFFSM